MKKSLLFLLILVSSSSFSSTEIKGNPEELKRYLHPDRNVISLEGVDTLKEYADKGVVSIIITTEEQTLSASLSKNEEIRNKLSSYFTSKEIPAKNIKNSKFSSSPQYGWFGKEPDSYSVINRMEVTIFQPNELEILAKQADVNKEVKIGDITFEHTKEDESKNKVKKNALSKILQQKQFYEASLGVKLTPIGIRDANISQRPTRGAEILEEEVIVTGIRASKSSKKQKGYDSYSKPKASFEQVKYNAKVIVEFSIE